ncbi:MAG: cation transporter [Gemmatimonadota bacterium]|nr:cation transporter [Gemmatimonadota bacterium]
MRKSVSVLLSSVFVFSLIAATGCSTAETRTTKINVPTAQCMMCANNIEKALKKVDGVSEVAVDMDVKVVSVTYDATRTEVAALEKAITGAGYQANQAAADSAVYAKLPDCCKVPQTQ